MPAVTEAATEAAEAAEEATPEEAEDIELDENQRAMISFQNPLLMMRCQLHGHVSDIPEHKII